MFTLNCKGKILSTETPLVMGIINATPDSFYKGDLNNAGGCLSVAETMVNDGADILDIGGQSTRPGSERITEEAEKARVIPVIKSIHEKYPDTVLSIDTYYSSVAVAAVEAGASIINDISAGSFDREIISVAAQYKIPYVCMHMKGTPETMQSAATYDDVLKELLEFFLEKTHECRNVGVQDIIIDPGFGFGKNIEQNLFILKNLSLFKMFDCPLLVGLSRKSTIYKLLNIDVKDALNGTTVLNTLALNNGADLLRVHDVKEAKQAVKLFSSYKKAASVEAAHRM